MKKVMLIGNIKEDGSTSMHVYLKDVVKHVSGLKYFSPSTDIKPSIYKLFIYPLKIPRGYDLYHIIDHSYAFLAFFLPKRKTVITCHDLIPLMQKNKCKLIVRLLFRLYISGLKRARYIFTISENTKKDLIKLLKIPENRIKLIPYGIDLSLFKVKNRNKLKKKYKLKDKIVLFSIGSVFYKNTILTLKSIDKLRKKYPNILFVKVGDFLPLEQEFIKRKNLEKHIILKDSVNHEILSDYYNFSDIFVFPSLYEGFGRPPLEAMACGVPVVTSNVSSIPEVVGDAAIKVDPKSVSELSEAIERLIEDKKLREEKIKKGFENIKRFSWDDHAKLLKKYYTEITG